MNARVVQYIVKWDENSNGESDVVQVKPGEFKSCVTNPLYGKGKKVGMRD